MKLQTLKPTVRTLSPTIKPSGAPSSNWRVWYTHARWRKLRARQLFAEPLCAFCDAKGLTVEATIVDHVEPHKGDRVKFWAGPFRSLCKPCHDSTAKLEQSGRKSVAIGLDGWPVEARGV